MIRVLEELARVVVYSGGGALLGYLLGMRANDRHRLVTSVLNEAEKDMPTRRPFLSSNTLQSLVVILVMVALLLTGITWLKSDSENAAQDERSCRDLADVVSTLKGRTAVYQEAAEPERQLWIDMRRELIVMGAEPSSPLVRNIDKYLTAQEAYIRHLKRNPYPSDLLEDC